MIKIEGTKASKGIVVGPAFRPAQPQESEFVEGSIIVTEMTTPDDVPLMVKCGGIVTFNGYILCHAAIVSRELGIPCVVAVPDAVGIRPNSQVTVNGDEGTVEYE